MLTDRNYSNTTFLGSISSRWFWQNWTLALQSAELNSYGIFQPRGPNFLRSYNHDTYWWWVCGDCLALVLATKESTQRVQTLPRLKSDLGFNLDFWINLDPDPEICQIAPKMYRIHSLVGISPSVLEIGRWSTAWEMLINLLKSAIPQWWEKLKSDPESVSGTRSPPIR